MVYIVILFASELSFAGDHYEFYQGIRQMAMGGASIGVVDDETALALNPAALGKLRDTYITLADPVADIGSQDDQIAGGSAHLTDMTDPQKALDAMNKNPGTHLHGMGEVFPSIVFPNFGIGVLGRAQQDAQLSTDKTKFDFEYENDFALVVGLDIRFWSGIIKLGVNGRLIDRTEISQPSLDATSTALSTDSMLTEGMGLGTDVGLIITAPIAWLPSVSAVVRDVGRTTYGIRTGLIHQTNNIPNSTPQTVNAAFSFSPILGNHVRSMWTFEYADITNGWEDDVTTRHYHGGVEFNVSDFLFIRGGYNQGYWTGGIELAIQNYQIQLTSYGEEVGTSGNLQEDRRYMGGFAIRF
jgi:hypothetical protein